MAFVLAEALPFLGRQPPLKGLLGKGGGRGHGQNLAGSGIQGDDGSRLAFQAILGHLLHAAIQGQVDVVPGGGGNRVHLAEFPAISVHFDAAVAPGAHEIVIPGQFDAATAHVVTHLVIGKLAALELGFANLPQITQDMGRLPIMAVLPLGLDLHQDSGQLRLISGHLGQFFPTQVSPEPYLVETVGPGVFQLGGDLLLIHMKQNRQPVAQEPNISHVFQDRHQFVAGPVAHQNLAVAVQSLAPPGAGQ